MPPDPGSQGSESAEGTPPPQPAPSHVPAKHVPAGHVNERQTRIVKPGPPAGQDTSVTRVMPAPTLNGSKQVVLVCDDILQIRKILCFNLKAAGYETIEAEDGEAALAVLENQKVDAALLDVMTPKVDGFTACARIKANPKTAHLPIIMLTACSQKEDILRALSSGACDYIVKPFKKDTVLAKLQKALEHGQAQASAPAGEFPTA